MIGLPGASLSRRVRATVLAGVVLFLGAIALSACQPQSSCTTQWQGDGPGAFEDGARWSTGVAPGATDRACAAAGTQITVGSSVQVTSLELMGEVTVSPAATLTVSTTAARSRIGTLEAAGTVAAAGRLDVELLEASGATFAGGGTLTVQTTSAALVDTTVTGSQALHLAVPASISGALQLCDSAIVLIDADLANPTDAHVTTAACGAVVHPSVVLGAAASATLDHEVRVDGVELVTAGTVRIAGAYVGDLTQTAGTTELTGTLEGTLHLDGGVLAGTGTVHGTVAGAGRIDPGDPTDPTVVGILGLEGWQPAAGAQLHFDLAGPTAQDALIVQPTDLHEVAIDHAFVGGYVPTAGARWPVVERVTGTPSSETFPGVAGAQVRGVAIGPLRYLSVDDCAPATYHPGADLDGVAADGIHLFACGLDHASLVGASLTGADLVRADLSDADLTGADLAAADLLDADLSRATLRDTDLTGARLEGVTWSATTCPDGTNSDEQGGTCLGHLTKVAATFTVDTTTDADDANPGNGICATAAAQCSLRAAITEANGWTAPGADVIELGSNQTYALTRSGADDANRVGDLDVAGSVVVHGHGSTISAAGAGDRALHLRAGSIQVDALTVTGGSGSTGGGVLVEPGTDVALASVTVSASTATGAGGGIRVQDAPALPGATLALTDSTVTDNRAGADGGGIAVGFNNTAISVVRSTVSGNHADRGWGGGLYSQRSATIDRSTFSGNTATGDGGGVYVAAGALTMTNSTLSGNTAGTAGGIRLWGGTTTSLTHVTVTRNGGLGGAITANAGATVSTASSIVGDQSSGADCSGAYTKVDGGQNVESGTSCGFSAASDRQSTNAKLKPLAVDGGTTAVHRPAADSPAIGLVPNGTAGCGTTVVVDQRGMARPQGTGCDAGAAEWVAGETTAIDCDWHLVPGVQRQYCDLTGQQMIGMDATGADLTGANLSYANFVDTDLKGATFTDAVWKRTWCPDRWNSDARGFTCAGSLGIPRTFTVTSTVDADDAAPADGYCATAAGVCTLRAAITEANGFPDTNDRIELAPSTTYPLTLAGSDDTNARGDLDVNAPVTINGHGSTVRATGLGDRVLGLRAGTVEVKDLTLTGGSAAEGGAVLAESGVNATLTNVTIAAGTSTGVGGGLRLADATALPGATVSLVGSTVTGNNAGTQGGGIYVGTNSTFSMQTTTVTGNHANNGWGGGVFSQRSVAIDRSTVSTNTATGDGGGVYLATGSLSMSNSTVSGNTAGTAGGIRLFNGTTASLSYVTVTANRGAAGAITANASATVTVTSSIVAAQTSGADCSGSYTKVDGGQNVESATSCGFTAASDRQDTNPKLDALAVNGGATAVHRPSADSPVIGLVPNGTAGCGSPDQRGTARPQGTGCESGAVEWIAGETTASDCSAVLSAGAKRQWCDLSGQTMTGQNATGADLTGANLTGANLTGTDLQGASLTGVTWSNTVCPDGTNSNAAGGTCTAHLAIARTFTVNSTTDDVDATPGDGVCATASATCTLRAAISEANAWPGYGTDTIELATNATYSITRPGNEDANNGGDLDLAGDVRINGHNAVIVGGLADERVLQVRSGVVTLHQLRISGGRAVDGGAIHVDRTAELTLSGVRVANGYATGVGGGIRVADSATAPGGKVTLLSSQVQGNLSLAGGGGVYLGTNATLTASDSWFGSNEARGSWGGGVFAASGSSVTLDRAAVFANLAGGDGGGLYVTGATLALTNATVSGNTATSAGGGVRVGNGSTATLTHVTMTANSGAGGALQANASANVTVTSSIIGTQTSGADCSGSYTKVDGGQNVESATSCGFTATSGRQNADPKLKAYASNGGPSVTNQPWADSPAVNLVPVGTDGCGTTVAVDQRGTARPQGGGCDSGAVELVLGETTSSNCSTTITAGANRRSCDLAGLVVEVVPYYLTPADLRGVNFEGANLTGARFANVDLTGASFGGANLTNATFIDVSLGGNDFTGATVRGASIDASTEGAGSWTGLATTAAKGWAGFRSTNAIDLSGADVPGADLTGLSLPNANWAGADLSGATLTDASIGDAVGADLHGVTAHRTTFAGDLSGASLTGADLTNAVFSDAVLTGTDLAGATVQGATFDRTPTLGAASGFRTTVANGWSGLKIRFAAVDLRNTDLRGADLRDVRFGDPSSGGLIDLSGSNLTGADATGSQVHRTKFTGVSGINTVTGLLRPQSLWTGVDLSGSGLDLAGASLANRTFTNVDFTGVNFTGADLSSTNWGGATVTGADFTGTGIGGNPSFTGTIARSWAGTDLGGAAVQLTGDLHGVVLTGANLAGATISDADLTGAQLTGATITGARFQSVTGLAQATGLLSTVANGWAGIRFEATPVDLHGADLRGANFTNAVFGYSYLSSAKVDLSGANLTGATFTGASIPWLDVSGATGLTKAQLLSTGTDWGRTNLAGVDLSGADLRGRSLELATFTGANLSGADLRSVRVVGSNVTNVNLTDAKIAGARFGDTTGFNTIVGLLGTYANGWDGTSFGSIDGLTISNVAMPKVDFPTAVTGATFVAVDLSGNGSLSGTTFTSTTWTTTTCPDFTSSAANGGTCVGHLSVTLDQVAVGPGGMVALSPDGGGHWISKQLVLDDLYGVAQVDGTTMLVGSSGYVVSTTSPSWSATWSSLRQGTATLYAAAARSGQFVAVGAGGAIRSGSAPNALGARTSGTTSTLRGVTWTGSLFVAVGDGGAIVTSTDGQTWTVRTSGTTNALRGVAFDGTNIVAVGDSGTIVSSTDGVTWTARTSGTTANLRAIAKGTVLTVVGDGGTVLRSGSTNPATWTSQTVGTQTLRGVTRDGTTLTAVGDAGMIWTTADGTTWTQRPSGLTTTLAAVSAA